MDNKRKGNNGRLDAQTTLAQKDKQIATLKFQLEAQVATTSHIETRLLHTLDTLDALQQSHAVELVSVAQEKTRLAKRLDSYIQHSREIEAERDDLRDAVNELIARVEITRDYAVWPCAHMHTTAPLAPLSTPSLPSVASTSRIEDGPSYTRAIMDRLVSDLDLERKAHARTRILAERQLALLQAQIAHRDSELEAFIIQSVTQKNGRHASHPNDERPGSNGHSRPFDDEFYTPAEMTTIARNRVLEADIRILKEKLQQAKESDDALRHSQRISESSGLPVVAPRQKSRRDKPPSQPFIDSSPQTPTIPLEPIQDSVTPLRPPESVQPQVLVEEPTEIHAPKPMRNTHSSSSRVLPHQPPNSVLHTLDRELASMAADAQALETEKRHISDLLQRENQGTTLPYSAVGKLPKSDQFDGVLLLEAECIRLKRAVEEMQSQLRNLQQATEARESHLNLEIARLNRLLHHQSRLIPHVGEQIDQTLLDTNGQVSNHPRNSAPLRTTSSIPIHRDDSYVDPPSIPLPPSRSPSVLSRSPSSPKELSSPPPTRPPLPSLHAHSDSELPRPSRTVNELSETRIAMLERELDIERRRVAGERFAMQELRGAIEHVRDQIVGGSG